MSLNNFLLIEYKISYYIDTDEIPGFFLLLKNYIFILHTVVNNCISFLSFKCEDIDFVTFADESHDCEPKFIDINSKHLQIFLGNLQKYLESSEKVCKHSYDLRTTFGKSSEIVKKLCLIWTFSSVSI